MDNDLIKRKVIRLKEYDYSSAGAYFATVCTNNRRILFGEINHGEMDLNDCGKIVEQCWYEIPRHYPNVELDAFVIMPNHVHGIVIINDRMNNGRANDYLPLRRGTSKTIGSIVRGFKTGVTQWMRQNTNVNQVWQRGYYEHIIRNERALNEIREYVLNNPFAWDTDCENPKSK